MLLATIRFSGSPAAMQTLTQHLSLDHFRRASQGNLLRLSLGKVDRGSGGARGGSKADTPTEQTAVAKVPILLLPHQVGPGGRGKEKMKQKTISRARIDMMGLFKKRALYHSLGHTNHTRQLLRSCNAILQS